MGLKILHTADWHLDSPFGSLPEAQREQLCAAQRKLPERIAQLCRGENCDLLLIAGDVFDGKPTRQSIDAVKRALAYCAVPVFISPGNHDFCSPDSPWLTEVWPENVHIFTGGLTWFELPELDCRVYGAGYGSMDCPPLLDGFRAEGTSRYCIGLLHGDPLQLSSPCCPVTAAQVRESGLDYLALGHIHRSGSFRAGNTLCAWPGCPMGRGWDETGEKGVFLVTLDDGARCRQVFLDVPRFYTREVSVREDALSALEGALPPAQTEDLFRVTLTGTGRIDTAALQTRFSHLGYLELLDETEEPADPWECAGEDSLRGVYFRMLRELDADPELIAIAADISRRLLDGREVELP